MARTALEAMACGLPVILTPNTGACDLVEEGINGHIVPIRDPKAIEFRAMEWWDKTQRNRTSSTPQALHKTLSKEAFGDSVSKALNKILGGAENFHKK